jgi:serine/threonine protein kinase
MSSPTLTSILFASLLDSPAIVDIASQDEKKAVKIIKKHFTFSAEQISDAYQNSYRYALTVVCLGLAMPENWPFAHDSETSEFSKQIEQNYVQPFVAQQPLPSLSEFRQQAVETVQLFTKKKDNFFQIKDISEQNLAELINYRQPLAITDIVLEQHIVSVSDTLAAFLRYQELLGNAILFFFREILRQDEQQRLQKTQTALQQKGFCIELQQLQSAIETAQQKLNHAITEQPAQLVELAQQLQKLQQTQMAWQTNHESLTRFAQCFGNRPAKDILAWAKNLYDSLSQIDTKKTNQTPEPESGNQKTNLLKNLTQINQFMTKMGISSQINPRDELVQFDSNLLQFIQEQVQQLTQLPTPHPQYSQLSIKIGRILSSIGEWAQAEPLFLTAIKQADKKTDQALAYYNLFQVRWRKAYTATSEEAKKTIYAEALTALKGAIEQSNGRYALHDINKGYYPIEKILGVSGMGCVLLCQNHNHLHKKHRLVVVKCFWEHLTESLEKVFKESFVIHDIAGDLVPEPLDFGYADNLNKRQPYLLTEYIQDAIDGEAWLEKYGPLSLETGLPVALQIAEGLQRAHNKGIFHFNLKPTNLLLYKSKSDSAVSNANLSVKMIDFGLARVTGTLRQAVEQRHRSGLIIFGQTVFGTLDYASPEQQGLTQYGKPDAKSDLFSFGATMYRLWTGNSPRHFRERELPNVPALRDLLFDCVADNPEKRPQSTKQLIDRLKAIQGSLTSSRLKTTDKKTLQSSTLKIDRSKTVQPTKSKEQEQEEKAWQAARQKDTSAAYKTYLDGSTLKNHAEEAKQRLNQKYQQAQEQAEKDDENAWNTAIEKDTMAAYQAYLDGTTLKKHAFDAKQRLSEKYQKVQEQAKQKEDETAWQQAIEKDTMAAYQAYLEGATLKKYANQAKQKLTQKHQQAQEQALQKQDETAWQQALEKNTKEAYQAYLEGATLKKYANQAKQKLTPNKPETKEKEQPQSDHSEATVEESVIPIENSTEAEIEDQQAWQRASQQDTQTAYQAYLNGQTLKKHAKEAEKRLIKLVEDETAWQRTIQKDNQSAYLAYIEGRTLKKHAQEAEQRLRIKTEEDEKAWEQAGQKNTQFAYQAYLDGQTLKNYAQEAKQRLVEKTQEAEEEDEQALATGSTKKHS